MRGKGVANDCRTCEGECLVKRKKATLWRPGLESAQKVAWRHAQAHTHIHTHAPQIHTIVTVLGTAKVHEPSQRARRHHTGKGQEGIVQAKRGITQAKKTV